MEITALASSEIRPFTFTIAAMTEDGSRAAGKKETTRRSQTAATVNLRSGGRSVIQCHAASALLRGHFARKRVARLILPGDSPHRNYETVPGIDRRDCQRQIGEFLFREMLACFLKDFAGSMTLLDICDRLRPGESGALPLRVIGRFSPGIQAIEPLLAFSRGSQILPMHVNAVGASVNLRIAQLNQSHQFGIEPGLRQIFFETRHCLEHTAAIL